MKRLGILPYLYPLHNLLSPRPHKVHRIQIILYVLAIACGEFSGLVDFFVGVGYLLRECNEG